MDKMGGDGSSQSMCSIQKIVLNKLVLYILLIIFTTGCSPVQDIVVQDIVPAQADPLSWYLSPSGDKLIYSPRAEPEHLIVRFLATDQEVTIADCSQPSLRSFVWLDNETVYCYEQQKANSRDQESHDVPVTVIGHIYSDTDTFQKIPIKAVTADQVELSILLKDALAVYRLQPSFSGLSNSLLILETRPQENAKQYYHLTGIENLNEVLKNHNYTSIPLYGISGGIASEKVYSPNQAYYFVLQDSLRIYEATNDRLLTEFKPTSDRESFFQIGGSYPNKSGGWAADSSGVYFQIFHFIGLGHPVLEPIQKLCVP